MRIPFTTDLINSLTFDNRPVGVDEKGGLIYQSPNPKSRDWTLRDSKLPGFGIRLTEGSKSYFVQRKRGGSSSDRFRLTEQHSLTAARSQAQQWLGKMANGEDPRPALAEKDTARKDARIRKAYTIERMMEAHAKSGVGLRKATVYDREIALRWLSATPLAKVPLDELTRSDVEQTFLPIFLAAESTRNALQADPILTSKRGGGPQTDVASAWKLLRHCAAAWTAEEHPKGLMNPFAAFRKRNGKTLPKVKRRTTSLQTQGEAGTRWLKALLELRESPEHAIAVVADYFLCLLLWGGRRTEVQKIRWSDVDFTIGTVRYREAHTKTRRALVVPLAPWAAEILRDRRTKNQSMKLGANADDWVFASVIPGKHVVEVRALQKQLAEKSGVKLGPHDLRRTVASDLFGDTQNLDTVGLALGHAGSEGNVSAGYVVDLERLRALRPLYEERERRLRRLAGVETTVDPLAHLSSEQRAILNAAKKMLKDNDIDVLI